MDIVFKLRKYKLFIKYYFRNLSGFYLAVASAKRNPPVLPWRVSFGEAKAGPQGLEP
jgi:hypothetical protein